MAQAAIFNRVADAYDSKKKRYLVTNASDLIDLKAIEREVFSGEVAYEGDFLHDRRLKIANNLKAYREEFGNGEK